MNFPKDLDSPLGLNLPELIKKPATPGSKRNRHFRVVSLAPPFWAEVLSFRGPPACRGLSEVSSATKASSLGCPYDAYYCSSRNIFAL